MNDIYNKFRIVNIAKIISISYDIFRNHFNLFVILGLFYGFSNVLDGILYQLLGNNTEGIVFLINLLITSWASMALIYANSLIHNNKKVNLNDILRFPKEQFFSMMLWILPEKILNF